MEHPFIPPRGEEQPSLGTAAQTEEAGMVGTAIKIRRDRELTRKARYEAHALKLPRIGKEAIVDINSCDNDTIRHAFGGILNYVGTNTDG